MKIIFFGTPQFASEFLKGLVADPSLAVVGVVTQPDEPVGRKHVLTAPPVKQAALELGLPVFQPTKLSEPDFRAQLKALNADLGVVVAFGRLLSDDLLNSLPKGFINVHPSLLPKWRGPSPIIAAIAAGDKQTGVTVMQLVKEMDAGPILAQSTIELDKDETTETLTAKVVEVGVPLLVSTVKDYAAGNIRPEPQVGEPTFCKLLTRDDGKIDWNEPAEVIERKIRALNPWPGTFTSLFKVFKAKLANVENLSPGTTQVIDDHLFVGTGSTALEILELQPPTKARMSAHDFLNGHKDLHGTTLT